MFEGGILRLLRALRTLILYAEVYAPRPDGLLGVADVVDSVMAARCFLGHQIRACGIAESWILQQDGASVLLRRFQPTKTTMVRKAQKGCVGSE
jgi:hypothetical protein